MKTELDHIYITPDGKKFIDKREARLHEETITPSDITISVYYHQDEKDNTIYDFDEMANELETKILKALHVDCSVEIKEK